MVHAGAELDLVWTPETPVPVPPERVPFLMEEFRRQARKGARNAILSGAAFVALVIVLACGTHEWTLLYRSFFAVIGAALVIEGIWQYWRARHYSEDDAAADAGSARFTAWIKKQKLSSYTAALVACIVLVGVVQSFGEHFIDATGLVKPAVWQGEVWRLFTATLMHADLTHFWMNSVALLHFARIAESTVQRACVPLVFLITAPIGSVFSVVLYPHTTSIGASGGLMGLLGFITAAAYFHRATYPHKYFRQLIEGILSVGLFGLLGFAFIDNAAHLGGLVGGLLLGWLVLRKQSQNEKLFTVGGVAASFALAGVAVFAVYRMLR